MWDLVFGTMWGWIGTAGLICLACLAVAWLIPQSRAYAVAISIVAVSVATAFTKGWTARGTQETKRKEEAVQKARKDYDKIDNRNDDVGSVSKRLRDGSF